MSSYVIIDVCFFHKHSWHIICRRLRFFQSLYSSLFCFFCIVIHMMHLSMHQLQGKISSLNHIQQLALCATSRIWTIVSKNKSPTKHGPSSHCKCQFVKVASAKISTTFPLSRVSSQWFRGSFEATSSRCKWIDNRQSNPDQPPYKVFSWRFWSLLTWFFFTHGPCGHLNGLCVLPEPPSGGHRRNNFRSVGQSCRNPCQPQASEEGFTDLLLYKWIHIRIMKPYETYEHSLWPTFTFICLN